jgi:hypothetical protein
MDVGHFRLLRELQESERNVVDRAIRAYTVAKSADKKCEGFPHM